MKVKAKSSQKVSYVFFSFRIGSLQCFGSSSQGISYLDSLLTLSTVS